MISHFHTVIPATAGVQRLKPWMSALAGMTAMVWCKLAAAAESHGSEEGHAEAAHAESAGGLPQFDPSTYPSQIFWLAVTFVFLYFFFSKSTLPAIGGVLESRRKHIQDDLDTAEKFKEEAQQARQTYETLLERSRAESTGYMTAATTKVKEQADASLKAFREKSASEQEALEKRLNDGKKQALKDMDRIVAELASEAAARLAGITPDLKQAQDVVQSLKKEAA